MFSKTLITKSTEDYWVQINKLKEALESADAVVVGAGAGLSTAAGFTYAGDRFQKYFSDFISKYGIRDMYSGGFYSFPDMATFWGWWSRHIWVNRYMKAPGSAYDELFRLVQDKDYFVLTTNVDHCFQKAGFDKHRMFYTQGDYGLFQCSEPCHQSTYDNEDTVRKMLEAQGYIIDENSEPTVPDGVTLKMTVPTDLIPQCPVCGKPMNTNLRADNTFVEDEGWHRAAERYENFLRTRGSLRMLFLELGVGYNTPGIIKYPFWQMTAQNSKATYACINYGEAVCPREIKKQSICIDGDIGEGIKALLGQV